jgi:hypothetical protein
VYERSSEADALSSAATAGAGGTLSGEGRAVTEKGAESAKGQGNRSKNATWRSCFYSRFFESKCIEREQLVSFGRSVNQHARTVDLFDTCISRSLYMWQAPPRHSLGVPLQLL